MNSQIYPGVAGAAGIGHAGVSMYGGNSHMSNVQMAKGRPTRPVGNGHAGGLESIYAAKRPVVQHTSYDRPQYDAQHDTQHDTVKQTQRVFTEDVGLQVYSKNIVINIGDGVDRKYIPVMVGDYNRSGDSLFATTSNVVHTIPLGSTPDEAATVITINELLIPLGKRIAEVNDIQAIKELATYNTLAAEVLIKYDNILKENDGKILYNTIDGFNNVITVPKKEHVLYVTSRSLINTIEMNVGVKVLKNSIFNTYILDDTMEFYLPHTKTMYRINNGVLIEYGTAIKS